MRAVEGVFCGTDPGSRNFGYSYIEFDLKSVVILSCGMVRTTITNLTDKEQLPPKSMRRKTIKVPNEAPFVKQLHAYSADWKHSLGRFKPIKITSERYQSRGMGGATIEHVNIANGVLSSLAYERNVPIDLITAATWKNQVNRISDLEAMYKEVSLPPHVVDANFIALYGALKLNNLTWSEFYVNELFTELCSLEMKK